MSDEQCSTFFEERQFWGSASDSEGSEKESYIYGVKASIIALATKRYWFSKRVTPYADYMARCRDKLADPELSN